MKSITGRRIEDFVIYGVGMATAVVSTEIATWPLHLWLVAAPVYAACFGILIAIIYRHFTGKELKQYERELTQRRASGAKCGEGPAVCIVCGHTFWPGFYPDPKCLTCRNEGNDGGEVS